MPYYIGILFAFGALVCWGFGDFFIQQTTRAVGTAKALFFIGIVGFVGLIPFVRNDLMSLDMNDALLLGLLGLVVSGPHFLVLEALREGKIAIVEPIIGFELPIVVALSVGVAKESLTIFQFFLIGTVFIGIMLAIIARPIHFRSGDKILEKGVLFAIVGSTGMGLTNLLVGLSSRASSPLVTIWVAHSLLAFVYGSYTIWRGGLKELIADVRNHPKIIIGQSVLDNAAWIAFAVATTYIPITIATTVSESYIALTILLGLFVSREKLRTHQIAGVIFATIGVIVLSYISS